MPGRAYDPVHRRRRPAPYGGGLQAHRGRAHARDSGSVRRRNPARTGRSLRWGRPAAACFGAGALARSGERRSWFSDMEGLAASIVRAAVVALAVVGTAHGAGTARGRAAARTAPAGATGRGARRPAARDRQAHYGWTRGDLHGWASSSAGERRVPAFAAAVRDRRHLSGVRRAGASSDTPGLPGRAGTSTSAVRCASGAGWRWEPATRRWPAPATPS